MYVLQDDPHLALRRARAPGRGAARRARSALGRGYLGVMRRSLPFRRRKPTNAFQRQEVGSPDAALGYRAAARRAKQSILSGHRVRHGLRVPISPRIGIRRCGTPTWRPTGTRRIAAPFLVAEYVDELDESDAWSMVATATRSSRVLVLFTRGEGGRLSTRTFRRAADGSFDEVARDSRSDGGSRAIGPRRGGTCAPRSR